MIDGKRLKYSQKLEYYFEMKHIPHPAAYKALNISKQLFHQLVKGQHEPRAGVMEKCRQLWHIEFVPEDFTTWI